ncbi:protein MAIN-LIKE 1-like [Papaver somniferum]|uniref:protein MAIN-LIKE 1-like n=1 Tax=Papaver somniferum TaxID=3469 RepID=UPI000E70354B|nr:protein MAIN-LIKE 1-like [Papaver somniferum]
MTIVLEDVQRILGLEVLGKAVKEGDDCKELGWDKIYELTKKLFGWDKETTMANMYKTDRTRTKTITFVNLVRLFGNMEGRESNPEQVRQTAAAYLLFTLGSVIFPDANGNMVHMNYLQYLDPLDRVHEYSWGTSFLAHFLAEMRRASKANAHQFNSSFTLIQVQ